MARLHLSLIHISKMSSEVYDTLKKGEEYFATNVDVLGTDYYGYYVPLYQPGTKELAGSVFCGRTQNQVTQSLRNTIISMAVVMLVIFLAAFIIVLFMVKRIVKSSDGAVSNLGNVAKGALQFEMKPVLLERGDEVGDIARAIQSLIHSLREILTNITSVSYTHLDVYKRQGRSNPAVGAGGQRRLAKSCRKIVSGEEIIVWFI